MELTPEQIEKAEKFRAQLIEQAMERLVEELKPDVAEIEKMVPTTKNHYGAYLTILSMTKDKKIRERLAVCLVRAGANEQGVKDALNLSYSF